MVKLVFGDPYSIAKAKEGEISPEALNGKTEIEETYGCVNACEHCSEVGYRCMNCGEFNEYEHLLIITDMEGKKRCTACKFLIE